MLESSTSQPTPTTAAPPDAPEFPETKFVYVLHEQAYCVKINGRWAIDGLVSKEGLKHYLLRAGYDDAHIKNLLGDVRGYKTVDGFLMEPGAPDLFENTPGSWYLNTWVPPTLKPADSFTGPEQWPAIDELLNYLTNNDPNGREWLEQWIAAKVQNPTRLPKVAVVFTTQQGGGKGTLGKIIRLILGWENTASVDKGDLVGEWTSSWADKLFILADEVVSADAYKDQVEKLKILIDGGDIKVNTKFQHTRWARNRIAWMFASNDSVNPVSVERGDRRFTVFSNMAPVSNEWARRLLDLWRPDDSSLATDSFTQEIRHWAAYLLKRPVDFRLIQRPYENEARAELISASSSLDENFVEAIENEGLEKWLEGAMFTPGHHLPAVRSEWDFGEDGISTRALYEAYRYFASVTGGTIAVRKIKRFTSSIKALRPSWEYERKWIASVKATVPVFSKVPRTPKGSK